MCNDHSVQACDKNNIPRKKTRTNEQQVDDGAVFD